MPTNLTRSVAAPANGESTAFTLDVVPQTADEVQEVSADLHLVLNGVTNIVPFAFADGTLTNAISLVDGEAQAVQMGITAAALEEALGGPFMTGDEVTYFAAVRYNSANGALDPAEVYETRYFPDNATTSNEYWIVEGTYGVGDLSANTFTVTGDALSCIGTPDVTTEGVKFTVHGFNENRISSFTVNLNGQDYHPFEGLDTNAQVRVTGEFELPTGLAPNTQYTVTITATDAGDNPITPGTFTFWTLPEAPAVTIEGISTSEVRLTASGSAAGYEVPSGWTKTGANTWTKGGGTPNQMAEATVYALNADGGKSAPTAASGYTLAAVATKAPEIEKIASTVMVGATDYVESDDGNPEGTEYAVRVTRSSGGYAIVTTNGVPVWKPLSAWADDWVTVGVPTIDLAATNYFSFVTRNFGHQESDAGQATTNCFFEMNAGFNVDETAQTAEGSVNVSLVFFDPAQSADAQAEVEYKLGDGEWTSLTSFGVPFADQNAATNFTWDAWTAVGQTSGTYEYQLRVQVKSGSRASEWTSISGTLDFTPPTVALTSATPDPFNAAKSPMVVTATFSEDVTGFTAAGLTVVNGTATVSGEGKVWTISVTPSGDGDVSVTVNANAAMDAAGNGNTASASLSRRYDATKPTVALSSATPADFNEASSPMVVTATFSEDVTGLSAAGLTVVNGTATVSGEGNVWTITVTPSGDGDVSVTVNANAAMDAAGNGNTASASLTRTYDTTPPTVELTSVTPAVFNAAKSPMVVTATFSEDVTGLSASGLTVVNGTATVSGEGKVWTISVTPVADGDVSVTVNANAAMDAAGNGNTASTVLTRKYDGTAPTVELVSSTPDPFNAAKSPMVVTATFSEDVTGLSASGLTVVNGTATVSGEGKVWTISVTPVADGDVSVAVNADAAADAAGNGNTASAALKRKYDGTAPTVELVSSTPNPFNAEKSPMVVTATFSEDVTGFTAAGLTVVNGTATVSGEGNVWMITVTPSGDGDVSVTVNANAATDAAGNGNTASAALTRKYDATKPTVALSSETPDSFNAAKSPMVVTATFSEDVTGLSAAGLTVVNGTATVSGEGKVWTISVTPVADGDVSVTVNADAAADAAGNGNTASAALKRKYDGTAPTVELVSSTPDPFNAAKSPMVVTATFSEDVTGLSAAGLAVVNGTATVSGEGKVWTISVTPVADGDVSVTVNANAAMDAAGNGNTASASLKRKYDGTAPTVELVSSTPNPFNAEKSPMVVTATFSEDVTGLSAAGLTVVNGTATVSGEGNVWTITVTPSGDGDVSVAVNANAAMDAAGNGNMASAALARKYDATKPTVALSSETPDSFNAAKSPMVVTATFSEDVTGLSASGLTVVNGTATVSGEGKVWTISVTPVADGDVSVTVNANAAMDAAGNGNTASAALTRLYDTEAPAVVISSESLHPFNAAGAPWVVTAEFTEPVTNFTAASVSVVNGTVASVVNEQNADTTYTITVNPTADGDVTVQIPAGAVADAAGNGNTASDALARVYDTIAPTVELTSPTPDPFSTNVAFTITATFSEPVTNFTAESVTVANGTVASVVNEQNAGTTYTITVEPLDNGDVTVQIQEGVVADAAGNQNEGCEPLTRTCDMTAPTVELSSDTPEYFNSGALVVTATFSVSVTNFTANSVEVTNGTVVDVVTNLAEVAADVNRVYTLTIEPTADGEVVVLVKGGAVVNIAGSGNTASEPLTRTYDTTPPAVALASETPLRFNAEVAFTVTATFSEPVTNFTAASVTVANGSVASVVNEQNADTTYTITVNPTADGDVTVQIPAGAVTDLAGNHNEDGVTLARTYDTEAPTVTLESSTQDPFGAESAPMTVTATFSEPVTNLTAASVSVVNGTVTSVVSEQNSYATYTITVDPSEDGTVTVQIAANATTDLAGNGNVASAALTRKYDNTPPSVTLSSESLHPFNAAGAPWVVTAEFTEPVTNFTAASVAVVNGTVASVVNEQNADTTYTITINPTADGDVTVQIPAGAVADSARKPNVASEPLKRTYDTTRPTVALASDTPELFNGNVAFTVSVTFSEPVTNFTAASVSVVNGTVTSVVNEQNSYATYTITIKPKDDGDVTVQVPEKVVADAAGNPNTASAAAVSRTYDNTPPTVELTTETPAPPAVFNAAHEFFVTATFSEPVTNFTAAAFAIQNGSVAEGSVAASQDAKVYTARIIPAADGEVTVQIPKDAVTDLAGNGNTASDTLDRLCDITPPSVTLTGTNAFNKAARPLVVTVEFSEPVTNFTSASVTVNKTNGDLESVTVASVSDEVYTVTIIPKDTSNNGSFDGAITIQIPASVVADAAGNPNVASDTMTSYYDNKKPTKVSISGTPAHYASSSPDNVVFDFTAAAEDSVPLPLRFEWTFNGVTTVGGDRFTGFSASGNANDNNKVTVYAIDAAGNKSTTSAIRIWTYRDSAMTGIVFGGGEVYLAVKDNKTNDVSFTALGFKPGETGEFTLSGFDLVDTSSTAISNLQMWFIVCDTLYGEPWHVKVDQNATYDKGTKELKVKLPAAATEKANGEPYEAFFIRGIDNKGE